MKSKSSKSTKKIKTAKVIKPKHTLIRKSTAAMSVEGLIALITDAIQYKFMTDKSAPGLTIAKLKNGEMYASVVRFNAPFGKDKRVEYKAHGSNLIMVLRSVAQQIVDGEAIQNPVDQLSHYLTSNHTMISSSEEDVLVEEYRHFF